MYFSNACNQFEWADNTSGLDSKHEKSDNMCQVSLGNSSAESVIAEVATLTKDTKFSYHNVVKVA